MLNLKSYAYFFFCAKQISETISTLFCLLVFIWIIWYHTGRIMFSNSKLIEDDHIHLAIYNVKHNPSWSAADGLCKSETQVMISHTIHFPTLIASFLSIMPFVVKSCCSDTLSRIIKWLRLEGNLKTM